MGSAIIGLVGVVIGGVLTSFLSAWQERRRERLKLRTAARLVLERFEAAADAIAFAQRISPDPDGPAVLLKESFQIPEWPDARVLFADRLDSEAFALLSSGVKRIKRLHEYAARFEQQWGAGRESLLPLNATATQAIMLLEPMALLRTLAEADLAGWVVRHWRQWRRKPTLTELARRKYLAREFERFATRDSARREARS